MSELNVGKLVVSQGVVPPSVTSSNRPVSPIIGSIIYNTTIQSWERWTGVSWEGVSSTSFVSATGGIISYNNGYKIHTFTGTGQFIVQSAGTTVECLIVGGGGSGGPAIGGGGGAGGVLMLPSVLISPGTYNIDIGAGGSGNSTFGGAGTASTAFGATAAGGGTSGRHASADGTAGGSGGGAASNNNRINVGGISSGNLLGPNNGTIYGNRGGNQLVARTAGPTRAAGGGGAGSPAQDTNSNFVASEPDTLFSKGGDGIISAITGTPLYYGGGGGGGCYFNGYGGNGGLGGGGGGACNAALGVSLGGTGGLNDGSNGPSGDNLTGGFGGQNTGSGGGGGSWSQGLPGSGGSGIVIIRYRIF